VLGLLKFSGCSSAERECLSSKQEVEGSNPSIPACGWIAQLEEHWFEKPGVGGSIPSPTIDNGKRQKVKGKMRLKDRHLNNLRFRLLPIVCLVLRSSVIGNALGFDPREYRFDPCLRSEFFWRGEGKKRCNLEDATLLKRPPPEAEATADVAQKVRATVS
jgi:hypothetical protein